MPIVADEIKTLVERAYTDGRALVHGVDWDFYEAVLEEVGDRRIFVTYDRGELEIMSPSYKHGFGDTLIGRMIGNMVAELRISIISTGTTTWKRKDLLRGLEPDGGYYVQKYARMKGKTEVDLSVDPPPDLVIEVDISSSSLDKQSGYATLGISELWRYDNGRLSFHRLRAGKYKKANQSFAFPGLTVSAFERFIKLHEEIDDADATQQFLKWVRQNMKRAPRRRAT